MIGVWIPGVEKPGRCEDCFALQGDETDCWCGLGVWDLQESPPAVVPEGCKVEERFMCSGAALADVNRKVLEMLHKGAKEASNNG